MLKVYSFIFYLITPLLLLKLWRRGKKSPAYRQRIAERFGFASQSVDQSPLWIHAVSVGEVVAIAPLIRRLHLQYPEQAILLTTSTPTGAQRVRKLFKDNAKVFHQYCPYDQPCAVSRFLSKHQPIGLLIVETELWPNMLAQCKQRAIPVMLANGRMSKKSKRGYQKLASMTATMLSQVDLLVAQYASDGEQFKKLGLSAHKLIVSGSVKFDMIIGENVLSDAAAFKARAGSRATIILGSSHVSEEQGVLEQMADIWQQYPDMLLIIVPRHPERFSEVAELATQYTNQVLRRSQSDINEQCQVYIGDTMGELSMLYACADIAVVGGSFVALGGQSPIEPAAVGKGVIMGPQQYNFSVICPQMQDAGGLVTCDDFNELQRQLISLFADTKKIQAMGECALGYVSAQRGASETLFKNVEQLFLIKK
ncbi:lipid IV(A) 3-deoxy-D-manno-octulosonic acid transferase [Gammaproteobacteria bacterium AS21]